MQWQNELEADSSSLVLNLYVDLPSELQRIVLDPVLLCESD